MFTSQKIGRTVFVSLYFDKIVYYANAMDGMYVNAHKKWPSHKFLVCTSLLFNKNIPQVAARATRLQWLKIEQKHRMTSSTWFRGCRTKWVIGHRTWSIIGHSTIKQKTPLGWIQIGESRIRGVARIPLRLKPSRDSRTTSQRDSPIWIQPLGVFRYKRVTGKCMNEFITCHACGVKTQGKLTSVIINKIHCHKHVMGW